MKEKIKKYWFLITLIIVAFITVLINQFPRFIEQYYSTGLYPYISRASRFLLGWIPFSVGDLLYGAAIIWIIIRVVNFIKRWRKKQLNRRIVLYYGRRVVQTALLIYISFNWLWGFNYNRLGSAYQMQLKFERYSNDELIRLTDSIVSRLNIVMQEPSAAMVFGHSKELASLSAQAFKNTIGSFPFVAYKNASVKPGMLYQLGNYIGFLGYLNPFTGEAQLNTTIPAILLPYVCCHEMAHQLGYASESEANFIGYLACKESSEAAFRYSVYFDLFSYTIGDLYYRDSTAAKDRMKSLPQKVKEDRKQVRAFFTRKKNPFSPAIDWVYDKYLKLNSQPKGKESYNEVVGWLIAYAKRYGWDRI
ncbi:MAG: DUF3810 domain-containing protein [Bacteroidota bacterium]